MFSNSYAYGNWIVVASIIALALFFIAKYLPLRTKFEKRTGGTLIAFLIALFTEMFGFPLTIYLLSSFFGVNVPLTHEYGHLFAYFLTFLGVDVVVGWFVVMAISTSLIIIGLGLITNGWRRAYHAKGKLVTTGIYAKMRHPQYSGLFLVIIGFMVQWPTLITIIMFPFLIEMYYKLAKKEERDIMKKYKKEYLAYIKKAPMFIPKWRKA